MSLIVRRIRNGTVIDHIKAGEALRVLEILDPDLLMEKVVAVVMNVKSKKMGRKDIVKVEEVELTPEQVNKIALISPRATINIIRNYQVAEKRYVKVPDRVDGIIRCNNPTCITNHPKESIRSVFLRVSEDPLIFRCYYCGSEMKREEIAKQLSR